MRLLKPLRVVLAVLSFLAIVSVFVDFTGMAARYFSWLPKFQVVPALLALNVAALLILLVLTAVFGRIYCSVICPLGIWQDIVIWLRRRTSAKKKRRIGIFRFEMAQRTLRVVFLVLFAVLLILGFLGVIATSFAGLLDPYSAFGRIAGQLFVPVWRQGMTSLADLGAEHGLFFFDSYPAAFAYNAVVLVVALITLIVTTAMAWTGGRAYCNKVCPVGTILGFVSRRSLLKINIDKNLCNHCGSCGRNCKAQCIDSKNQTIDYSRCVTCFDCIGHCSQKALSFSFRRKKASETTASTDDKTDGGRRAFLVGASIMAGSLALRAADKLVDGGLTPLKSKQRVAGAATAVPPGAVSIANLRSRCTACQLCVSRCPEGVLKPSYSPEGFMQPVMVFTDGFCRTDCTACSQVCPTGAIRPIDTAQKAVIKVGNAVVDTGLCISAAFGQHCGNCARHCPTGAIKMVRMDNGHRRPTVDENRCIGCGECEFYCPVGNVEAIDGTTAAIHVEGLKVHREL